MNRVHLPTFETQNQAQFPTSAVAQLEASSTTIRGQAVFMARRATPANNRHRHAVITTALYPINGIYQFINFHPSVRTPNFPPHKTMTSRPGERYLFFSFFPFWLAFSLSFFSFCLMHWESVDGRTTGAERDKMDLDCPPSMLS